MVYTDGGETESVPNGKRSGPPDARYHASGKCASSFAEWALGSFKFDRRTAIPLASNAAPCAHGGGGLGVYGSSYAATRVRVGGVGSKRREIS